MQMKSQPTKTFVLLNDTRVDNHMGCRVVNGRVVDEMSRRGYKYAGSMNHGPDFDAYLQKIGTKSFPDLIVMNGEGTMHDDQPRGVEMLEFVAAMKKRGSFAVLINSIWQNNTGIYNSYLRLFDAIYVREPQSQREIAALGHSATVCPDLTLSSDLSAVFPQTKRSWISALGNKLRPNRGEHIFITDCAVPAHTEQLKALARTLSVPMHLMGSQTQRGVEQGLKFFELDHGEFMKPRALLIGGRFHACCFAILAGIPFLYLSSNTHKIEGTLEWFGIDPIEILLPRISDNWTPMQFRDHVSNLSAFTEKNLSDRSQKLHEARMLTENMFYHIASVAN
jgi:hypothetical protein